MELLGRINRYYTKANVGVIHLLVPLKIGDRIFVETLDPFDQEVLSMHIDQKPVTEVEGNLEVGILLAQPIKGRPKVYKI